MKDLTVLNYNLGNACNLKCKFCYNDYERKTKQFYKTISEIKEDLTLQLNQSKNIFLIGGEPLYHPNIFEIIDFAYNIGFKKVSIVTNGIRFSDKEFTRKLLSNKIQSIIFSIHSHNEILDSQISSRKNIFKKRIDGLKNFKEFNNYNIKVGINIVINAINVGFMKEIVEFYVKLGFLNIHLYGMLLNPTSNSQENINMITSYEDIIHNVNSIKKDDRSKITIHWLPLCISSKLKNIDFIREVSKSYIYNIGNNGNKLFDNGIKSKIKLRECNKCYAFGKFCFGTHKTYIEKYGDNGLTSISKEKLYKIIKKNNDNKKLHLADLCGDDKLSSV